MDNTTPATPATGSPEWIREALATHEARIAEIDEQRRQVRLQLRELDEAATEWAASAAELREALPATPAHLAPAACYVCGGAAHGGGHGHIYWSNADAERELAAIPSSDHDPAAAYVAEHRAP